MRYDYLVFKCPSKTVKQAGFGLIELMVSISIMAIVTIVVLVRQDAFNSAVLLRNQTYEVAFDLRDVQLRAVSASGDINPGSFRSVLGIHFATTEGNDGQYRIFQDSNGNGYYDAGEEYGVQGQLDPRFVISELRLGGTEEEEVSVLFLRPNFDARFYTTAGVRSPETILEIDIERRGSGDTRTLEVTASGQITVQ
jgi:prepilin-type N-terminal cleavage/methylation domain-containing protein